MLPHLYVFHFDVAVHLAAYLYCAVLAVYSDDYAAEFLPLQQALLNKGKLTCPDLPVSKHYRVGRWELVYQLLVLLQGGGVCGE